MRDVRIVALDQLGQCGTFRIRRITALHDGARSMFFRRVELGEARPLHTRLPMVGAGGALLLLHTIVHDPHLGAVIIGSVTNDHDLEDGIIGRDFEFVVELSDQGAKLLEESDAHGFQGRLALAGSGLVTGVAPGYTLKITVQPSGLGIGGNAPFRSSEKNAEGGSGGGAYARGDGD